MWIEALRRKGRAESLYVFNFLSMKEDYLPYVEHMERIASRVRVPEYEYRFRELITKIKSRCDDMYAKGDVVLSSFLFADEMAELATHMSFLLLEVTPKEEKNE